MGLFQNAHTSLAGADVIALLIQPQCMGLLTVTLEDPSGYGRIVRDAEGHAVAIVEQKDANEEQLAINECNTGIMAMTSAMAINAITPPRIMLSILR